VQTPPEVGRDAVGGVRRGGVWRAEVRAGVRPGVEWC
jgi:hypothetical protein